MYLEVVGSEKDRIIFLEYSENFCWKRFNFLQSLIIRTDKASSLCQYSTFEEKSGGFTMLYWKLYKLSSFLICFQNFNSQGYRIPFAPDGTVFQICS